MPIRFVPTHIPAVSVLSCFRCWLRKEDTKDRSYKYRSTKVVLNYEDSVTYTRVKLWNKLSSLLKCTGKRIPENSQSFSAHLRTVSSTHLDISWNFQTHNGCLLYEQNQSDDGLVTSTYILRFSFQWECCAFPRILSDIWGYILLIQFSRLLILRTRWLTDSDAGSSYHDKICQLKCDAI